MIRRDGITTFSATDLCNFLECPHLTRLCLLDLETKLERDPRDEEMQLIATKGEQHERQVLRRFEQSGEVLDLTLKGGLFEDRLARTIEGLRSGADTLYQAFLYDQPFLGYSDFLIRCDKPSELGVFSYEVMDAKLARTSKTYFIIQLCLYSELLAKLQGVLPEYIHVALGDGRRERFRLQDYYHYYRYLKGLFLAHTDNPADTYPEPCAQCPKCDFRTRCEKQRLADDHLSQVANIRKTQIRKLAEIGITTLAGLATSEVERVKGIGSATFDRLKQQAALQLYKRTEGKNKYVVLPPIKPSFSLGALPSPDPGDLFYDIEGDPLYPDGLEYLHGVFYIENDQGKLLDLWAHNHIEEKASFQNLIRFFIDRLEKFPDMHIYHYASYEQTALKRLMSKYGTMEDEVDELLRRGVLVDLYKAVRHNVLISEPSYSIKYLEHFYMEREAEVKTAGGSIVYYENYIETRDRKYLDDIKQYNLEDCRSLLLLRDWLRARREEQPAAPVSFEPTVAEEDAAERDKRNQRRAELQEKLESYEQALTAGLPDSSAEYTERQRINKLLFDLADFYRREDKPTWWRIFERQAMTTEELIDDNECLGGLEQCDPPPFDEKRSRVYTYRFPEQDHKVSVGSTLKVAETLEYGGSVVAFSEDERTIQIKRSRKPGDLPSHLDAIPYSSVPNDKLRDSLWRFIDDYVAALDTNDRPYPALQDMLERHRPRIADIDPGQPLLPPNPEMTDYIHLVKDMQATCLFIQGPPGTGKTYTASHLILGLMKAGMKVGVTANSHKVIHNLLDAVEERAVGGKYDFVGVKKGGGVESDSHYAGRFISTVAKADQVFAALDKAKLVAGTAWLFAEFDSAEQLDYLFIDEAGQVSLAHLIAAGRVARNIVLIGDQMQLAQPTQGVHPGESGQSALDYLLQGRNTIPADEGILLETTYRMHPDVCRFISDAIYDGRIISKEGLERQMIVASSAKSTAPGPGQPPKLPPSGIICEFVDHEDSVQFSPEEAERVRQLYEQLFGNEYVDRDGRQWKLTPDNILVVSPYNMQVNLLKRMLGERARVGTVDKIQGQEAEVVIVSMATSDPEDVPRGIDFLYSQNRLNVSLSRARILSILVMCPRLLNVRCHTISQMRLVNTLCWVREYTSGLARQST